MQHKCVKCKKIYEKGSEEILNGCSCGSKLFYFVKGKKKSAEEVKYFYEVDEENSEVIIFDIEAINVKGSGKYELNLPSLLNHDGLIYKYGDGKYSIDLNNNFKQVKKK